MQEITHRALQSRKTFYYLWLRKSWRQGTRSQDSLLGTYPSSSVLSAWSPTTAIPAECTPGQPALC